MLVSVLRKAGLLKRKSYFKENVAHILCKCFQKKLYLDGYWQNVFSDIRELLLEELSPNISLNDLSCDYLECIKQNNSCSIHVRRGLYQFVSMF